MVGVHEMTTAPPIEWYDGTWGSFDRHGFYSVAIEAGDYGTGWRARCYAGVVGQLHRQLVHVGPCFPTLDAAKDYCESDWLQGDE